MCLSDLNLELKSRMIHPLESFQLKKHGINKVDNLPVLLSCITYINETVTVLLHFLFLQVGHSLGYFTIYVFFRILPKGLLVDQIRLTSSHSSTRHNSHILLCHSDPDLFRTTKDNLYPLSISLSYFVSIFFYVTIVRFPLL